MDYIPENSTRCRFESLIQKAICDYEKIAKLWYLVALVGLIPVFLTFFIGFAPEGTDDKAWLDLGFTTLQPSELLKIAFIITLPKLKKSSTCSKACRKFSLILTRQLKL